MFKRSATFLPRSAKIYLITGIYFPISWDDGLYWIIQYTPFPSPVPPPPPAMFTGLGGGGGGAGVRNKSLWAEWVARATRGKGNIGGTFLIKNSPPRKWDVGESASVVFNSQISFANESLV
jgi:hypothetical protein